MKYLTMQELEAGLDTIRQSPEDQGVLELIVRRPRSDERQILPEGRLDLAEGLAGDNWRARGSSRTADGTAHPGQQITLMNARVIALLAQDKARWPEAVKFVNSPQGKHFHLRGINARVVQPGMIRVGDIVKKDTRAPNRE